MEDFFVYANIFSVKNTTDNTDLFEKILSIIVFVIINIEINTNITKIIIDFFNILSYVQHFKLLSRVNYVALLRVQN